MRHSASGHGPFGRHCVWTLTAMAVLMLPVFVGRADAGPIVLTGEGYTVTAPGGVSVAWDATPGKFKDTNVPFNGTLTIDASFSSNTSITLSFVQTEVVRGFGTAGGLRMALDSLNLNSTSLAWIGFTYQLVDKTVFPPDFNFGLQGAHKGVAHFHPQSDPGQTGDPTYLTTAFSVVKDGDNETSIGLGNGTVDSGDEFRLKEALIHERNYKDAAGDPILRKFDLELTPQTPEPASMTLLAVGALCMAGYGWRRHRKAEIEKRRNSEIQNIRA